MNHEECDLIFEAHTEPVRLQPRGINGNNYISQYLGRVSRKAGCAQDLKCRRGFEMALREREDVGCFVLSAVLQIQSMDFLVIRKHD